MRVLDISIVVKTFLRPQCLEYFLSSIASYQEIYDITFPKVIVIDDSDEDNLNMDLDVVKKFSNKVNICYKQYPYNSLGASKGRNVGVSLVDTPYLLLCDDDYIFDPACDVEHCLAILKDNGIDVLGGFYKNIKKYDDVSYSLANWIGFYSEGEIPTLQIFTDYFPDLKKCTVLHNFFLARSELFTTVGWDEKLKTNEHNEFFCRLEQKGFMIYFTNKLFIKHLHIDNNEKSYDAHRISINKPVAENIVSVFVLTRDIILRSTDITLHSIDTYSFQDDSRSSLLKRGIFTFSFFKTRLTVDFSEHLLLKKTIKHTLRWLRKVKNYVLNLPAQLALKKIERAYPDVKTTSETLSDIISQNKSLARFGDGELMLILGIGLGSKEDGNEYQAFDVLLQKRLREILLAGSSDKVSVAILPFSLEYDDNKSDIDVVSYWHKFLLKYYNSFSSCFSTKQYSNTLVSRKAGFCENHLSSIKSLWGGRKVLFVVGLESHFFFDNVLFDNIVEYEILYGPGKSAFSQYDELLGKICEYDKNWLIFLSLGPTATVLAYDLAQRGYQALDLGHLPNCYRQWQGKLGSPEEEDGFHKLLSKKQAIY